LGGPLAPAGRCSDSGCGLGYQETVVNRQAACAATACSPEGSGFEPSVPAARTPPYSILVRPEGGRPALCARPQRRAVEFRAAISLSLRSASPPGLISAEGSGSLVRSITLPRLRKQSTRTHLP